MLAVAYRLFTQNWKREEGQTMAEYGIILAVVAVLAIAAFTALQGGITNTVSSVAKTLGA